MQRTTRTTGHVSEYIRALIRRGKARAEHEAFDRLKADAAGIPVICTAGLLRRRRLMATPA